MRYRFAEFTLDTEAETLAGPNGAIPLRRRTYQLLSALVEHAPALIGRDQLIDLVWGHDALSPNVLPQTVSELRQALGDSAQSPRIIETRHRRGYRIAVPVALHDGCESSDSTVSAAGRVAIDEQAPSQNSRYRLRVLSGLMLALGVLLIASVIVWLARTPDSDGTRTRPTVALVVADPSDESAQWITNVGTELLTVALAGDDRVRLLRVDGRETSARASRTDAGWQTWLREVLGADYALTGRWQGSANEQSLSYALLRLHDGHVVHSGEIRDADLAMLVQRAATDLRDNLHLIDPTDSWMAELPRSPEARSAYYRGVAALADGEPGGAVETLQMAMADPQAGTRVRLALASAYRQGGHLREAREAFQRVLAESDALSPGERLRLEAEAALVDYRPADAAASLRALHRLLPDDIDIGLSLADAQIAARQAQAAQTTLASLERVSHAPNNDPRWHLARARLAHLMREPQLRRDAAEQALTLATRYEQRALAVQAQLELAQAEHAGGDLQGARKRLQDLLPTTDDIVSRAQIRTQLGSLLRDLGDFGAAQQQLTAATEDCRTRGDRVGELRALIERHIVESERGHSEQAYADLEAMQAEVAALDDALLLARYYNTLGVQAVRNNRGDDAERYLERAATEARRAQQPAQEAGAYVNLGQVLARNGRVEEAMAMWERALQVFRDSGDKMGEAITLSNLAASSARQPGQHVRGIDLNRQALVLFRELGAGQHLARTSFNLALALEREGDLAQTTELLEESLSAYRKGAARDPILHVAVALARVRLARAETAAAREVLESVQNDLGVVANPLAKSHVAAAWGHLESLAGDFAAAREYHAQALTLRQEAANPSWQWLSELDLQQLDVLRGRASESTRAAIERIAARQAGADEGREEMRTHAVEAAALLQLHRREQAVTAIGKARNLLAANPEVATGHELDRLALLVADGSDASRVARLQALASDAERSGFVTFAWRCRLDVMRLEAGHGAGAVWSEPVRAELASKGMLGLIATAP